MTELVKTYTYGENIGERTPVKFSQEGTVVKAASADDNVCGVTLYAGVEGAKGDVVLLGLALVATDGAVNAGDYLVVTEESKVKALDLTDNDNGDVVNILGQAIETASTDAHLWCVVKPQTIVVAKAAETANETEEQTNG